MKKDKMGHLVGAVFNRTPGYPPSLEWSGYKPLLPAVGVGAVFNRTGWRGKPRHGKYQ